MAGRIQGITVEIGGDTTKLQTALDVVADAVSRSASAKGTIVVPIPSSDSDSGTETGSETGGTTDVPVDVEIPVTWTEDGQAVCHVTYELNDEEITTLYPVETWHSGKHILTLYYPVERVIPYITNTFRVYLRMEGGTGTVDVGDAIASISGQSMAAAAAWDGKITVEETVGMFSSAEAFRQGHLPWIFRRRQWSW